MIHGTPTVYSSCAPPAEAFPEWPSGWYVVAQSCQLTRRPIAVELFGRRLVCFRSADENPVVMDAKCWHLGADLSTGNVVGDQIVCPFHGWRYGVSGKCEHIPSQSEIPDCARQRNYCATDFAGHVFVYPASQSDYPLPFFEGRILPIWSLPRHLSLSSAVPGGWWEPTALIFSTSTDRTTADSLASHPSRPRILRHAESWQPSRFAVKTCETDSRVDSPAAA